MCTSRVCAMQGHDTFNTNLFWSSDAPTRFLFKRDSSVGHNTIGSMVLSTNDWAPPTSGGVGVSRYCCRSWTGCSAVLLVTVTAASLGLSDVLTDHLSSNIYTHHNVSDIPFLSNVSNPQTYPLLAGVLASRCL
jgi:hypothetical protein